MRLRVTPLLALCAALGACDQPAPKCTIARGTFSARYTLVRGSKIGRGDCDTLRGDELSVQAYTQQRQDSDYPDPNHVQVGIQASALSQAIERAQACGMDNATGLVPYSLGSFERAAPGADDFCEVPLLTVGRVALPTQDACQPSRCFPALPREPAVTYAYEWSHVRVYVTAGANGTQLSANLKYTKDGCSAEYRVAAVYPSVSCALATDPAHDSGVNFVKPADCAADPPRFDYVASDALCAQDAPLSEDVATGSNLNPEFMVQCDPEQLRCVLSGDPPSLH
jgi:hypothetical protein